MQIQSNRKSAIAIASNNQSEILMKIVIKKRKTNMENEQRESIAP